MRLGAIIQPDEYSTKLVRGRPLINYQIDMFKAFEVEDILLDSDGLTPKVKALCTGCKVIDIKESGELRKRYRGIFFISGDLFVEEGFLNGFEAEGSYVFVDHSSNKRPNILFHLWEDSGRKEFDITGRIWRKIEGEDDLFYAENKLSLIEAKRDIEALKLFSFDLDGTTILGKRPITGVREFLSFLKETGRKYSFLTNNSSRTNKMHAENLKEILEFPITEENIMSSIDSLEVYLREKKIKTIYPFVNERVKEYLSQKVSFSEEKPEMIVVGFNTDATYKEMYTVSRLIFEGVPYLLIHPDFRCPTEFGYIPDAGSFGKMFELTTDKYPIWVGGKPNPIMVDGLSEKYGIPKEEIGYVGDRLYTDIEMAKRAGIIGFLVLTGETSLSEYKEYVEKNGKPEGVFIIDNLTFLRAFMEKRG